MNISKKWLIPVALVSLVSSGYDCANPAKIPMSPDPVGKDCQELVSGKNSQSEPICLEDVPEVDLNYPIRIPGKQLNYSVKDLAVSWAFYKKGLGDPIIEDGALIEITGTITLFKKFLEMVSRFGACRIISGDLVELEKVIDHSLPITISGNIKFMNTMASIGIENAIIKEK